MVIVADRNGQLCNRLFHFSYFIANAIEFDYRLSYPCFDQYADYFESTIANNFSGLNISLKFTPFRLLDRIILKFRRTYPISFLNIYELDIRSNTENDVYDLKNDDYQKLVHKKIVFTRGWMFRDEENLKKHRERMHKIFTPIAIYQDEVKSIISKIRSEFDCIIGVHIRRGDYSSWNEGKYFFDDELYAKKMFEVEKQMINKGKSCCFFVASNEHITVSSFKHLNTFIEQRHFITDLYCLAECDYIMGPPSTFNYWAAYYGNKPIFTIQDINSCPVVEDFKYY